MISALVQRFIPVLQEPSSSKLFNEDTFYAAFTKDIKKCRNELIIESAFMTQRRVSLLLPHLIQLKKNKVRVVVNTRNPLEHDRFMAEEATKSLSLLLSEGVQVIFTENIHRKTAIVDRKTLWEGSLNILSQNNSREVMRRTDSPSLAWGMVKFSGLDLLI